MCCMPGSRKDDWMVAVGPWAVSLGARKGIGWPRLSPAAGFSKLPIRVTSAHIYYRNYAYLF